MGRTHQETELAADWEHCGVRIGGQNEPDEPIAVTFAALAENHVDRLIFLLAMGEIDAHHLESLACACGNLQGAVAAVLERGEAARTELRMLFESRVQAINDRLKGAGG